MAFSAFQLTIGIVGGIWDCEAGYFLNQKSSIACLAETKWRRVNHQS